MRFYMNTIESFLTGEMDISDFKALILTDTHLQLQLRTLIPDDAKSNAECGLWKKFSFSALNQFDFDLLDYLHSMFKFDDSIADNLNIWSTIRSVYTFYCPEICCTSKYSDAFDLYLDVVKDRYDGPEVRHIVNRVVLDALHLKTKKERIAQAKRQINELFHVANGKYPRWIQGAEWPMGEYTPMAFISQERRSERINYIFEDVDTKKKITVVQYF